MSDDRPVIIDAFSCQSGASAGFERAGFRTIGIEINPEMAKRSPFEVVVGDVLEVFPGLVARYNPVAAGGSPPCQRWTDAQVIQGNEHPDLITPFRKLLLETELPYWIENVGGAARRGMLGPSPVRLCGLMFGLKTDRHRYFETNFPVEVPAHPVGPLGREDHADMPKTKMGRPFREGELRQYVGNFHGVGLAREDLGVPWMNRDGARECIPPAYSEYLGRELALYLGLERAA